MGKKEIVFKFNKKVDTGPLPKNASPAERQAIQDERIRRQITSRIKPSGKGKKK